MKKIICSILACICLLTNSIVYANSLSTTSNMTHITDTNVKVINYIDGEEVVLYTGPISQFEGGAHADMDFTGKAFSVVLSWDGINDIEVLYYIYPIRTTSNSLSMNATDKVENNEPLTYQTNQLTENVLSDEAGITFTSQIKINDVNTGEGGLRIIDNANLECAFNVTNSTNAEKKVSLLLATYDDNKTMMGVHKSDVILAPNLSGSINLVYDFDAETEKSAKLMLWHSGIMPVRASIDFDQTSGVNAYYYNEDNKLLQVDKMNGKSIFYTYDKMGNLLKKTVSGGEDNV